MWAAIITAVGGIFGAATQGNNANNAAQRAEYADSLAFSQQKDLAFYGAYQNSIRTITIVSVVGLLFLIAMVYFLSKNK
jgi:hypothetical protein